MDVLRGRKYASALGNICSKSKPFKHQPHRMVKHTQTIRQDIPHELFVFDHFVRLVLKELRRAFCWA